MAENSSPHSTGVNDPVNVSRSARIRKTVLFGLLIVMMTALLYDYRVARPAVAAAYDQITDESRKLNGQAGETFSNEDVRALLGKTPSEEFTDGSDIVEVYDYPGGIPGRPHRLFTVFKANGKQKLFYRHAKFAFETRHDVATIADPTVMKYTDEEFAELDATAEAESQQMGGGGQASDSQADVSRSADGEGQRRRRDPAEMFAEQDADGDGKLSGDEIPGRMADSLSEIDTDGDGSVSKEEIEARFAQMRERFAGGAPRGGGPSGGGPASSDKGEVESKGDPKESGRPELEE